MLVTRPPFKYLFCLYFKLLIQNYVMFFHSNIGIFLKGLEDLFLWSKRKISRLKVCHNYVLMY